MKINKVSRKKFTKVLRKWLKTKRRLKKAKLAMPFNQKLPSLDQTDVQFNNNYRYRSNYVNNWFESIGYGIPEKQHFHQVLLEDRELGVTPPQPRDICLREAMRVNNYELISHTYSLRLGDQDVGVIESKDCEETDEFEDQVIFPTDDEIDFIFNQTTGILTLKSLIQDGGISPNHVITKHSKSTLLHESVSKNDVRRVKMLLDCGASLKKRDINGQTPIHIAFSSSFSLRDPALLPLLLSHPSFSSKLCNRRDHKGWSALHLAFFYGDVVGITSLLKKGADPSLLTNPTLQHRRVDCMFREKWEDVEKFIFNDDFSPKIPLQLSPPPLIPIFTKLIQTHSSTRKMTKMYARVISMEVVKQIIDLNRITCSTCKKELSVCQNMKLRNFKKWLFVHRLHTEGFKILKPLAVHRKELEKQQQSPQKI